MFSYSLLLYFNETDLIQKDWSHLETLYLSALVMVDFGYFTRSFFNSVMCHVEGGRSKGISASRSPSPRGNESLSNSPWKAGSKELTKSFSPKNWFSLSDADVYVFVLVGEQVLNQIHSHSKLCKNKYCYHTIWEYFYYIPLSNIMT